MQGFLVYISKTKKSSVFNLQTESRLQCKCLSKGYTFQIFLQFYVQIVKMFPICAVNSTRTSRMQCKSHFWRSSLPLGNKSLPHLKFKYKWLQHLKTSGQTLLSMDFPGVLGFFWCLNIVQTTSSMY